MCDGSGNNPFPHDGENGINCTGYGCDCDEKNYGYYNKHPGGGGRDFIIAVIATIVSCIISAFVGEFFGALLLIFVGMVLFFK